MTLNAYRHFVPGYYQRCPSGTKYMCDGKAPLSSVNEYRLEAYAMLHCSPEAAVAVARELQIHRESRNQSLEYQPESRRLR